MLYTTTTNDNNNNKDLGGRKVNLLTGNLSQNTLNKTKK